MWMLGPVGFTAPWLLLGLLALPVLWIILRAVPPAPVRRRFPGVALLLGLKDDEATSDRTPWWLLLLRMLAVAAMIIGLAGPVLNPQEARGGDGPLLVVLDGSWAGARDWPQRMARLDALLQEAGRANRPVAVLSQTAPERPEFRAAAAWRQRIAGLSPAPYAPTDPDAVIEALPEGRFESYWMSDGLARDSREPVLTALESRGPVRVFQQPASILALTPPGFEDGAVQLTALRSAAGEAREITIEAHGRDPAGIMRVLARLPLEFPAGAKEVTGALNLPAELRARVAWFGIAGVRSAGAVALTDDSLRRREIALIAGRDDREGLELLSPLHYLEQALVAEADLLDGALLDILPANPDVVILADVATLAPAEQEAVLDWVERGGQLVRFAGPRVAASDISRDEEAPLMPVRLRAGGRTVGGAMSWGEPKRLAPFPEDSPFFGLQIPGDVEISAQVMAQPDPALASRVIAQLDDGTPLVTRKAVGAGQVVLFHVTANAEWSTLPLSGLFVQMLERLSISGMAGGPAASEMTGTTWQARSVLDGFGALEDAGTLPGVPGEALLDAPLGPDLLPGLYQFEDRSLARNVVPAGAELIPARWPSRIPVEGLGVAEETVLTGGVLGLSILLLLADVIASLALGGRLRSGGPGLAAALLAAALWPSAPAPVQAQETLTADELALRATAEVALAYVITGDPRVDETSRAGLRGLSRVLFQRTSIEPDAPIGVDIESAELAFFPFLYWPVTEAQPLPSEAAYAKLNEYLRTGGMILFDTRDSDIARFGASSPAGRKLQQLARPLDIPPLEPVPEDHVLTRTFYLIQDFPGRHDSRDVWVEAAPPDAEQIEGMPFRNLNDGVTPVVIGGNDWAAAWAVDERGGALRPVGRGFAGERQRELAYRFGVNLIMHVLTGNYKSDQVHVPALLDRLGQ